MGKKKKGDTVDDVKTNPDICMTTGDFTLPNGDKYSGEYCAHRAGIIWRQGKGVYTSHEGHVYNGLWVDDKLVDNSELVINYPNGAAYKGRLLKNRYSGPGTYTLTNQLDISCEFNNNKPTGEIILMDQNGFLWRGMAKEQSAVLLPENVFYLTISNQQGVGVFEGEESICEEFNEEIEEEECSDECWRKIIFAKSKLTKNDVKFGDSKWFQDYEKFRKRKLQIERKLKNNIELDYKDELWLARFREFKNRMEMKRIENELNKIKCKDTAFDLNRKFHSPEFLNSCPEVKTFYATIQEESCGKSDYENKISIINESTTSGTTDSEMKTQNFFDKPKFKLSCTEIEKFEFNLSRLPPDELPRHQKPLEEKPRLHFTDERKKKILLSRINILLHEDIFKDDDEAKRMMEMKSQSKAFALSRQQIETVDAPQPSQIEVVNTTETQDVKPEEVLTEQQKRIKKYIEDRVKEWNDKDAIKSSKIDKLKSDLSKKPIKKVHMHSVGYHTNEIDDVPTQVFTDMFN